MWTYDQSSGELRSPSGALVAKGYSGYGAGVNNPALEGVRSTGPIPAGVWRMVRFYNSSRVGPAAITLYAEDGELDDTHAPTGRGAFRIHGDNARLNRTGSRGCIILPRPIREMLWRSPEKRLRVVA